ncbi:MAG: hypothetical protein M0Z94_09960 [Dehalococcoidales bacterium]|nr:hypothetical protein [Dehalococcoidales bacterium]
MLKLTEDWMAVVLGFVALIVLYVAMSGNMLVGKIPWGTWP